MIPNELRVSNNPPFLDQFKKDVDYFTNEYNDCAISWRPNRADYITPTLVFIVSPNQYPDTLVVEYHVQFHFDSTFVVWRHVRRSAGGTSINSFIWGVSQGMFYLFQVCNARNIPVWKVLFDEYRS